MGEIVFTKHRPFSFKDFTDIMRHKTYRNKISKLIKDAVVELDYKSPRSYHTLMGYRFGKSRTHTHTEGIVTIPNNDPIYMMLKNVAMGQKGIHNIRLTFYAPEIYDIFEVNSTFAKNEHSGDIEPFKFMNIDNAKVQIRIHKTDIVSLIIACSQQPFTIDYKGKTAFFSTLAQIRIFLVGIMISIYCKDISQSENRIPDYRDWVIRMWHFSRDSLELSKKDFHVVVERAGYIMERVYTKDIGKGRKRIRHEFQEYPNKSVLNCVYPDSSKQLPQIGTYQESE